MKYHLTKELSYSLATIQRDDAKTVSAVISIDLHETQGVKNRAMELMYTDALLSGAGSYTRATFLDAINQLGASLCVVIVDSILSITIRSKADVFSKVMELTEIMFIAPRFEKTELKRIATVVKNSLIEGKEDSKTIAYEQLKNALYAEQDRRYTPEDQAIIKTLGLVTPADMQRLHTRTYTQPWVCSIAASKTHITRFKKSLKIILESKSKVTVYGGLHQQKPPQPRLLCKNIPSRQNIDFSIGAPIPITIQHPDYLPLMFGITVLGKWGGFTGRLMSTVREQEGLTYGIYAGLETFYQEEQGYWRIMTFFAPDKAVQGLTSTFREVQKIHELGISEQELISFKRILQTASTLKHDSTISLLAELHTFHRLGFSLEEIDAYKKRLATITTAEVNDALRQYLNPQTLTISAAGPIASVQKNLETFAKRV